MPSMDSPDAIQAAPDGLLLADWISSRSVPRSTAYALLKAASITPERVRLPGSRSPQAMLSAAQVQQLDGMAEAHRRGMKLSEITTAITRSVESRESVDTEPDRPKNPRTPLSLLERLQAVDLAIATGAPLTTEDVAELLGARPGGDEVARGRVLAVRLARNTWSLESTDDA